MVPSRCNVLSLGGARLRWDAQIRKHAANSVVWVMSVDQGNNVKYLRHLLRLCNLQQSVLCLLCLLRATVTSSLLCHLAIGG